MPNHLKLERYVWGNGRNAKAGALRLPTSLKLFGIELQSIRCQPCVNLSDSTSSRPPRTNSKVITDLLHFGKLDRNQRFATTGSFAAPLILELELYWSNHATFEANLPEISSPSTFAKSLTVSPLARNVFRTSLERLGSLICIVRIAAF